MTIKESLLQLSVDLSIMSLKLDSLIALLESQTSDSLSAAPILSAKHNSLVIALLQCETIQRNLQDVKSDLPLNISARLNDGDSEIVQLREMVRACVKHGSVAELVRIVGEYEGNSLAFAEVVRLMESK